MQAITKRARAIKAPITVQTKSVLFLSRSEIGISNY